MVQQWHVDHDYDHPSHEAEWHFPEPKSRPFHKEFTIDPGFGGGSAHFVINH
jgi:hypothetical protein